MIAAGFGFRREATVESLLDALARAAGARKARAVAAPADKAAVPAFQALANLLGVPVVAVADADLRRAATVTQSAASLAARATGSVAEAAALAAAGPGARLLGPRAVSEDRRATCALAEGWTG